MDLWKMTDNLWKMADKYELDMENCRQSSCMITLNDHFTILASSLYIYHTPSFSKDYFIKQNRGKTCRLVYSIKRRFCYIQASLPQKMDILLQTGSYSKNTDFVSYRPFYSTKCRFCFIWSSLLHKMQILLHMGQLTP